MKVHWCLTLSVGLNIALVATAGYIARQRATVSPGPPVAPTPLIQKEQVVTNVVEAPSAPEPSDNTALWAKLESKDLRAYCANLRAVGCPERNLRDILLPLIDEAYRNKLTEVRTKPPSGSFWQRRPDARERRKAQASVQQEKAALILELFGVAVDTQALREWHREYPFGLFMGFLPEGKPEQVLWMLKKYADQIQAVRSEAGDILTPEDTAKLQSLFNQGRSELVQVVTLHEAEELEARATAVSIMEVFRESWLGLEMTGLEMRNLICSFIRSGNPFLSALLTGSRPTEAERNDLKQMAESHLLNTLGQERFAEYQRLQDKTYRGLFLMADKLGIPKTTMSTVYDVLHATQDEEKKLKGNPQISAKEREAALAENRKLAEQTARQLLGDQAFEELKKSPFR